MKPLNASEPAGRTPRASDTFARTLAGLGRLVDAITPWLLDLGGWIFGALIAFDLVILGALLTVGPVDVDVEIATAAFALALPADVAGFLLLRLIADMSKVSLADVAVKAFRQEGFAVQGVTATETAEKKQRRAALRYSYSLLGLTLVLTLTGVTAALWHMAWWIGVAFVAMALVSQGAVIAAITTFDPGGTWRTPAGEVEPDEPRTG